MVGKTGLRGALPGLIRGDVVCFDDGRGVRVHTDSTVHFRELISMQYFEGLSLVRIGEILGLHRNMVRKRLTRSLERLERALSEGPS